jgi:hypothetical protein
MAAAAHARRRAASVPKDVASQQMAEAAGVEDDDVVRQRIATGELVPFPGGEPPVREHIMAQLRARMAAPRPVPKAKAG